MWISITASRSASHIFLTATVEACPDEGACVVQPAASRACEADKYTASRSTVLACTTATIDRRRPKTFSAWTATWMMERESPPIEKKSSFTPTWRMPRTDSQIRHNFSSTSFRGGTKSPSNVGRSELGAGRLRRSTLPLGVSGSRPRKTNAAGIM